MKDNNKKVLIISREFIPYASSFGGVVRMVKLASFLNRNNFQVFTLSGKGGRENYYGYDTLCDEITCDYVSDKIQSARFSSNTESVGTLSSLKFSLLRRLKDVLDNIMIPDLGVLWVWPFLWKAKKIIKKNNIRKLIVTSPLPSTLVVGFFLKLIFKNNVVFIIDYRDSWNTTSIFSKKIKILSYLSKFLEKRILKSCDFFVYVTPAILKKINSDIMLDNSLDGKSFLVRNGFDAEMIKNIVIKEVDHGGDMVIGYFGAIDDDNNSFRNPTNLLHAVKNISDKINLKLQFYGKVRINDKWINSLNGVLSICENLSHSDALQEMVNVDFLLVLHTEENGADEVMPGKVYEYMATGKPILSIGPENLEVSKFVEFNKLGYVCENEVMDIEDMLVSIFRDQKLGMIKSYDCDLVQQYDRDVQYQTYLEILDN